MIKNEKVVLYSSLGVLLLAIVQTVRYFNFKSEPPTPQQIKDRYIKIPTNLFPYNIIVDHIILNDPN